MCIFTWLSYVQNISLGINMEIHRETKIYFFTLPYRNVTIAYLILQMKDILLRH